MPAHPRGRHRSRAPLALWAMIATGAILAGAAGADAASSTPDWPFAWRPNWIPGDPLEFPWAPSVSPMPGLLVALDPVTHRPTTPSAEQRRAAGFLAGETDAFAAPLAPLPVERAPGGGELLHLQGRFQVFSVARRDAAGHFVTDCSLDAAAARALLATPAASARPMEEK